MDKGCKNEIDYFRAKSKTMSEFFSLKIFSHIFVDWREKKHNLKVENYILFGRLSEDFKPKR